MKPKLLFVDDELQILEGIQDSLRKHRKLWNMSFVCGGEAAIMALSENKFDVIISDMRMPVVDGVDVLLYAKQHSPATIRIMLSGYSEVDKTVRVSSLAHRFLSKPCNLEELEVTIGRSLELSKKLNDGAIKAIAGKIDLLPAGKAQHQMLMELLKSEEASINDIADVIESDIALTTKVLHLVNSAFFRRQRTIGSAREAASYLGMDLIRSVVLADQLFSVAEENQSIDKQWLDQIQQHSWLSASIAKHLLKDTDYAESAFTAGLLHEIGALVLGLDQPEALNAHVVSNTGVDSADVVIVDESDMPVDVQLGAYLLNLWGMPFHIVEAVACYQKPSALEHDEFDIVGALHIANHLAELCLLAEDQAHPMNTLDTEYLKSLNLEDQMDGWMEAAQLIASDNDNGVTANPSKRVA